MIETENLIDSNEDPIVLFGKWFEEAKQKEVKDPNAMNLATTSNNLKPSSRIVLLKSFDEKGFVFYTNSKSKKGNSIISNPHVALNFYWKSLFRQIRIEGMAKQVSENEADTYFNSRPKESKIGAWASKQSSNLKNRKELENKFAEYSQKYKNKIIPRPTYWTGFRVEPSLIEFWQDMPFRLHDRVEYKKSGKNWLTKRLYP
tara:strand:- start:102 stop:707 length:606 start_codon:yes stop_codon:yes gene_type:complete